MTTSIESEAPSSGFRPIAVQDSRARIDRLRAQEASMMAMVGLAHDQEPYAALQVLTELRQRCGYDVCLTGVNGGQSGSHPGVVPSDPGAGDIVTSELPTPHLDRLAQGLDGLFATLVKVGWDPASKVWLGREMADTVPLEAHEWAVWSFPNRKTYISAVQVPTSVVSLFLQRAIERESSPREVDRG